MPTKIIIIAALCLCLATPCPAINLWQDCPNDQGDNGFFVYGYNESIYSIGYVLSTKTGPFEIGGVKRDADPWLALNALAPYSFKGVSPQHTLLAWQAPADNTYQFTGEFKESGFGTATVYVTRHGTGVFAGPTTPYLWSMNLALGQAAGFDLHIPLAAGELIDLGVISTTPVYLMPGNPSIYQLESHVYLKGDIVPLPASLLLMGSGLLGLGVLRWRRNRTS